MKSYTRNKTLLLKFLGASPRLSIIGFFLDNSLCNYSKNEIVRDLGMGRVTLFKYRKAPEKMRPESVP